LIKEIFAFKKPELTKIDKVNIFLAGNSSKSPIVKELFNKYIADVTNDIFAGKPEDKNLFELFPPLGSKEANDKLTEKGIISQETLSIEESLMKPTGKTGVAYGLIRSRDGGRIKVINRNFEADDETKFKYFLGISKKNKFFPLVENDISYEEWYEFSPAGKSAIEIYFTPFSTATTKSLPITETRKVTANIETIDRTKKLWIRAVKSDVIDYVVANENEIKTIEKDKLKVKQLHLKY